ncbi:MAG: dTDP-glucose 4,6-dehydratase [Bdellovibrionia bacterium]
MRDQENKSFLVTGGAGFIGSNFVEIALKQGARVVVLDALTYAGHLENLSWAEKNDRFQLIIGNICDSKAVSELLTQFQIDAVVNFAAESHVDRSIEKPSAFIETNIQGTFSLLNASLDYWRSLDGNKNRKKEEFRYLQVSTDEVYGSLGEAGRFSETTPYAPNSPYSASKAAGDHLVRAWHHTYGLPTLTTNCSNNYGPRQYPEKLIPHMILCALKSLPLPVYGDGGNVRDWIHVKDHCNGILLALSRGVVGQTYCFGGNAERNNLQVVRSICEKLDQLKPRKDGKSHLRSIQFVQDRLGHDRRYAIDDRLAESTLGFKRQFQFEDGLAQTIHWYLDHQEWIDSVFKKGQS